MKPTNYSSDGCDPISSNCVIWNGPDIECISLCKGDNVSLVVYKLATELCELMDTFKISNFDLSCFDLQACTPDDFKGLIQLLIDKICETEGVPSETPLVGGCPDCEVSICTDILSNPTTPTGDPITSMQLKDYVLAIGNKVCSLIGQIGTINTTLNQLDIRISALEEQEFPGFELPEVTPQCVLPATPVPLDQLLVALETEFCTLRQATGDQTAILTALQAACAGINTSPQLSGQGNMSDISGWYQAPSNLSQSFSNLWKTVCDIRNAVVSIQNNCCDSGCSDIDLIVDIIIVDPTTIQLLFTGSIPSNFTDGPVASTIVITDSGGAGPQTINLPNLKTGYYDTNQPYEITIAGPNTANSIYVSTTYRFIDPVTEQECSNLIQSIALNTDSCPPLILTADYDSVNYQFTWNGAVPTVVTMELYNGAGTSLVQSNTLSIVDNSPSGSFSNLTEGTDYNVRIVIDGVPCNFFPFTTLTFACLAPTLEPITIDYSDPVGNTSGDCDNPATGDCIIIWYKEYISDPENQP
jgi:hypothetical protein